VFINIIIVVFYLKMYKNKVFIFLKLFLTLTNQNDIK
jgi:hypothetical protein